MLFIGRWKISSGAVAMAGAVTLGLAGYAAPAGATPAARATPHAARVTQSGGVSGEAAVGTPQLNKTGTVQEVVRQLVQCGSFMYAVGSFTSINQGSTNYARNNIFRFSATAPYTIDTSWAPNVNGQVNSIAFASSNGSLDCSHAYIGGQFTTVNGTAVSNIAEIDTTSGNVVSGFGHSANFPVWTIVPVNLSGTTGHLLVGGDFTFINGSHNERMASVSPATGTDDGFVHLSISGDYQYCAKGGKPCTKSHHSEVYNQQLSHGGTLDLVEGHFTSVGGVPRQQIFMLNLAGTKATVTGWTSPQWDGSDPSADPYWQCMPSEAFYIRSAAWSPDDSTVYIAATGFHPAQNLATGTAPRTGLCDAVSAFSSQQSSQPTYKWIEYSGCDSYYSVGADSAAVYAAGHPRWADNPKGCNMAGVGAVPDQGLQGLNPANGQAILNSGGTAMYTMSRDNAGSMMFTNAGLWIASANRYVVNKCGDLKGPPGDNSADHAGICFLPY
jgi:hypothetical protein